MFLAGFILALVFITAIVPWWLSSTFLSSKTLGSQVREPRAEADFKSQSVISFSFILPIIVMALVFAIIVGSRITKELVEQGQGEFIFFSLVFPVFSFLIGYLYLKKRVLRD